MLTKELSPDSICKAPLILKSDSFGLPDFSYLWLGPCGYCSVVWGCVSGRDFRLREAVRFLVYVDS